MLKERTITHLFLDIGGVLLTNGWDHLSRKLSAEKFELNWEEMEQRHHIVFETFEKGHFTLDEYLNLVIFYQNRPFTKDQFKSFMFEQSRPYPEMIDLVKRLKLQYNLKTIVVSNEGRELNEYRIRKFNLNCFIDAFISSSYVHTRKPDPEIFQFALDIGNAKPNEVIYIENTPLFVEIAQGIGIQSILHKDYVSTCEKLGSVFN